jgi:pyrimidine-nucleoside phosphorylase
VRLIDLIEKKARGGGHTIEELRYIADAAATGSAPDYQLASWLMAVRLRGMSVPETADLTLAMAESGDRLDFSSLPAPKIDKHSTGGVGDGVSLLLAPLAGAAGLAVPMMSGRGLGHTGGTLDKLESIPGLRVKLSAAEITSQMARLGVCLFGQTETLAPADRKLYALRDASATVASLPLIVSSILSKKLAEGLDALVLDVKAGSGAIFESSRQGLELAASLIRIAKRLRLKCAALVTAMDEPLGLAVGNAIEMRQTIEILNGREEPKDFIDCALSLGGWMSYLGGRTKTPAAGRALMAERLKSGAALDTFKKTVEAQGGDAAVLSSPDKLPLAPLTLDIVSPRSGFIARLDARGLGLAGVALGAGRNRQEDPVDHGAGIRLLRKVGASVKKGEPIARLHASTPGKLEEGARIVEKAVAVQTAKPRPRPLILRILR